MPRLVLAAAFFCALAFGAGVPAPESHFGHKIGADRTVLDWSKVVSYFRALEKGSDRIRVKELGKSTEGRPFLAAIIASPATLRNIERYNAIQKRLADPRKTPETEAEKLIAEGKTVVMITCSVHATEIASTHTAVEYAWRLATGDSPKTRTILDNAIFILVPSLNPDGVDIVAEWYRKTLGTPHEGTSPPRLYQKYVGHDNNRDWYIFTQAETRLAIEHLHNAWHPQIVYDVHQMGPFAPRMFVPPWVDPIDPNIDPIIAQQCNLIGAGMAADLTAAGKTGVVINAMYDFWTPARHYQAYHGGLRILSESASARIASPMTVRPDQIGAGGIGYNGRERSWNHLEPWLGGEWKLRDIIDYQLIAMESVLFQAAARREDMLRAFYRVGRRAADRTSPWAFVVPAEQRDLGAAKVLLDTLAFGLVEVDRAGAAFDAGGKRYPAGTYVIRMQQPYSAFAKTLLERQQYPDLRQYPGGPPKQPYDVTAHTLPLLMGVTAEAIEREIGVPLKRAGTFEFARNGWSASDTDTWRSVNAAWKKGGAVWRDEAGNFFPASPQGNRAARIDRPRIGLYQSWMPSMDEGWTRWLLERFGFDYQTLHNADIQSGDLKRRFDALIFADQSAAAIANGYRQGVMPEEYTGGLGSAGRDALRRFVEDGGSVIFFNRASEYAVANLGVNVKDVASGLSNRDLYCPGSLLNVRLDTKSALALGLPEGLPIWNERSPAWEIPNGSPARVVARYLESGLLASGWLLGEKHLAGKAALVDYPIGSGRVILFGMRPQYRGQSYATFKLLFNALAARRE